jgi:acyl-CoA synthetase (AMP-forming)/AMP-acid ligase II
MNRKIDSVVKQAKQSRKQRAQRNLSAAPTLQSLYRKVQAEGGVLKSVGTLRGRRLAIPAQDCRERSGTESQVSRRRKRRKA